MQKESLVRCTSELWRRRTATSTMANSSATVSMSASAWAQGVGPVGVESRPMINSARASAMTSAYRFASKTAMASTSPPDSTAAIEVATDWTKVF